MLNVELVEEVLRKRGLRRDWVIAQIGLKQEGYRLLRGEWLPKNQDRKSRILRTLAKVLDVQVGDLLVRLEAKQRTA